MISIEDFLEDIVGKAMRGMGISIQQLANLADIPEIKIKELLRGKCDDSVVRSIAPHLQLDSVSLLISGKKSWRPKNVSLDGLKIFNSKWHDMMVNSFLVWDQSTGLAAAFDTGSDSKNLREEAKSRNLEIISIYLTHTHNDHIADLDRMIQNYPNADVYVSSSEPLDGAILIDCGHQFQIGNLSGTAYLTHGHSIGGLTYFINGLDRPVAIVGDALFAGSMGGGMVSYQDALKTNRLHIFSLPDNTVVCPGHGPITSIKEEKEMNPFYPEFKNREPSTDSLHPI